MKRQILLVAGLFCAFLCMAAPSSLWAVPAARPFPAAPAAQADPHEQLSEILNRPLYRRWDLRQKLDKPDETELAQWARDRAGSLFGRFFEWLKSFLSPRIPRASPPGIGLGSGLKTFFWFIAWGALALFVVAVIILIVRIVKNNRVSVVSGMVRSREQVADALKHGDALALAGDQWLDEAGRLAAEKNFRAMYRALYLALLSGLHSSGKIDFNRHFTNWSYVSRYRGEPAEREIFTQLTELFDAVWYGLRGAQGRDFGTLRRDVESLIGAGAPSLAAGAGRAAGGAP